MEPLAPSWEALKQLLPKRGSTRPALSRFMGFCTDWEYKPEQVGDGHFERFFDTLKLTSLRGEPRIIHRNAIKAWNWATKEIPGWPNVIVTPPPVKRDGYVLPETSFTAAFQSRLTAHIEYLRDPPEEDDDAPLHGLKETTLQAREFSLRQIASVLVHGGVPIDTLNAVTDLASRDNMDLLCQFYGERFMGRGNSVQVITLLDILRGIARHQMKDEMLAKILSKRIKKLCGKGGRRRGMTKKNKDRLLPFQDPKKVRDFLLLPLALYQRAIGKTPDKMKAALLMRNAVAMEIELMCPLRVANLANLCVENHIKSYKKGKKNRYRLYIPDDEVKNRQDISMDLPEQSCDLIQQYINDFRHLLVDPKYLGIGLTYLFPTREGKPMTGKNLGWAVCKILKTELGLAFNMHLYRHAACFFYLKQNPADYETMRRTLGHKDLSTTINFYAELEQIEAFKNFDEAILLLRGGAPSKTQKDSKKPQKAAWTFPAVPAVKFNFDFKEASDVI
jgi:site-specific recombinase XerD